MTNTKNFATFCAILAAAIYAINIPLSKILLANVPPTMMAAFLYLGAGFGLLFYTLTLKLQGKSNKAEPLTKKELPYTLGMIVLDIAAPIFLMLGINRTNSANVSLLNNFEIVATSLIAFFVFKEVLSKRLWLAIGFVTIASIILGFESSSSFQLNFGSVLVLLAATCWGLENNCTRMISGKSSTEIVILKGCFSGTGSLIIALVLKEQLPALIYIIGVLILGFVSYGLSIKFYILAQKDLGAAKTSAYYSIAPFLGVLFSLIIIGERPDFRFYAALAIMVLSTWLIIKDTIALQHTHTHVHIQTHPHRHGNMMHTHEHIHEHSHTHVHGNDGENHSHSLKELEEHTHSHTIADIKKHQP